MTPSRIGKYEIKRLLGEGATGSVYLAADPFGQREVALKVMKQLPADAEAARRQLRFFQNEAALAGKLRHAHRQRCACACRTSTPFPNPAAHASTKPSSPSWPSASPCSAGA